MTGPIGARSSLSAPPPWTLEGRAVVLPARGEGGLGLLVAARYKESPVGPYDELLWVPRLFPPFRVAAIRVSTPESVEWGRRNWGIPKELGDFVWDGWSVRVTDPAAGALAELAVAWEGPAFPLTSAWIPGALRRFEQPWEGRSYRFSPEGAGRSRLARVREARVGGAGFPELGWGGWGCCSNRCG